MSVPFLADIAHETLLTPKSQNNQNMIGQSALGGSASNDYY